MAYLWKRFFAGLAALCAVCGMMFLTAEAEEGGGSFYLAVVTANKAVIEPTPISYTASQSIAEALVSSGYSFTGIDQGYISEIEGVSANYSRYYDDGGYDLGAPASNVTALIFRVSDTCSEELLELVKIMGSYRGMTNHVQNDPAAETAYAAALSGLRTADADTASALSEELTNRIAEYAALLEGDKYPVSFTVTQGEASLSSAHITMTDSYGNVTEAEGLSVSVISGTYAFSVSDGSYNRTEGTVTVNGQGAAVTLALPSGAWFGDIKLLNYASKEAYPYEIDAAAHTVVCSVDDRFGEKSLALYAEIGADVPSTSDTKLRTIYTGTNGEDYSETIRSWNSQYAAVTYLISAGMEGRTFSLEAQYTGADGFMMIQSYTMEIRRVPTLSALSVTAGGTQLYLEFDPGTAEYALTTVSDAAEITAVPFDTEGYSIQVNGAEETTVSLTDDTTAVPVKVSYTDGSESTYLLTFTKTAAVAVTVECEEGVTVSVADAVGTAIMPAADGETYSLIPGNAYTYIATKDEWYHATGTFTASAGLTVTAATPDTADAMTDFILYNAPGTSTRKAYPSDRAFSQDEHQYQYTVPDAGTTAYVQATPATGYTAAAHYFNQTTTASTHGVKTVVTIGSSYVVSTSGSARYLGNCLARCGYSQELTLRLSKTSGDVTYYQDYLFSVIRTEHLASLSVSTADGTVAFADSTGAALSFDRDVTDYYVTVLNGTEELVLSGTFMNEAETTACCGGYYAFVNGTRYDSLAEAAVTLDSSETAGTETIEIEVCHADPASLPLTYTIHVQKAAPVRVTFEVSPADAVVCLLKKATGERIYEETENVFALAAGTDYSYTVTAHGYVGASCDSYAAPESDETVTVALEEAPDASLTQYTAEWPSFRADDNNNGVVDSPIPTVAENAVLYWATKLGDGYSSDACGCPIIVDGYLYTYSGKKIYKIDKLSGAVVAEGEMDRSSSFAINSPTYAEGMIFIGLSDGAVQAFSAETLESLWLYEDPLGGQPNCPIAYHDGYIYTGFWLGERLEASFVCLSVTDEDPSQEKETKLASWRYTRTGGFYWAGVYVSDEFVLIGTDDGASGYTTGKASLLSFSTKNGELLDSIEMPFVGDIRSSVTYDPETDQYYFTSKGGYFYGISVEEDGTFTENSLRYIQLYNYTDSESNPPMSTSTPTIYNQRAYVGVSGIGQFKAYSGHNIAVLDLKNWELAYTVRTQGYPQTSGILTTAYEESEGAVYIYFLDNYTPGKLRVLRDKPGQTAADYVVTESYTDAGSTTDYETAYRLFTPSGAQAQYAICSPLVDDDGTLYFKNDSAYLMAVGSTIEKLEITSQPDKLAYMEGEIFDGTGMTVTATYTNGIVKDVTSAVTWSAEALTTDDATFVIRYPFVEYQDKDGESGVDYAEPAVVVNLTITPAESDVIYGDVNGDETVDSGDAVLILKYAAQLIDESGLAVPAAADVNSDGTIDSGDAVLILKYAAQLLTLEELQAYHASGD
ncbi:MAG TPA: dockerin type I domain-containing protein [Oscillospiraceae bacterium]|nr:dockerin type I domain-containing protein [Oscillospiraceae bacterium]